MSVTDVLAMSRVTRARDTRCDYRRSHRTNPPAPRPAVPRTVVVTNPTNVEKRSELVSDGGWLAIQPEPPRLMTDHPTRPEENRMDENETTCGFVPFPGNGAYGHWSCDQRRWHRGPHRFRNYTIPRVPRFWRVRLLWRAFDGDRRLRRDGSPLRLGYRRALYPTTYDPVSP